MSREWCEPDDQSLHEHTARAAREKANEDISVTELLPREMELPITCPVGIVD